MASVLQVPQYELLKALINFEWDHGIVGKLIAEKQFTPPAKTESDTTKTG